MATLSSVNFLLIRTGLSQAFKEGTLNGDQGNDNPLAPEGIEHAKAAGANLANVLKRMQPGTVQIWTCNGVKRIAQTTQLVLEQIGNAQVSIHSDNRLGGKNHGKFNNSTTEDRAQNPEWQKAKEMPAEDKFKAHIGGGESKEDIFNKVSALFKEISSKNTPDTVVVITSNNVLEALGRPLSGQAKLKVDYPEILHLKQSNGILSFVQVFKV